jgi:Ca2+-binding EF-hand superfamily protein
MLKETGAGVGHETMAKNLVKDREYERIFLQLKEEFSKIDINRDGTISLEEIIKFLNDQTGGTVDTSIAEQIYNEMDEDGSGNIQLDEFIESYFEKQRGVKERIL